MPNLTIQMFGDFTIQSEENRISDSDNRTRKVWQLLAFLLCHKDRIVPRKELINILWGEDSASSNPENALKTTFHRARNLLNTLWPMAGHQLILFQDSGYSWNREIPISLDTKQFETICRKEHSSTQDQPADQRLNDLLYAISLYRGDFLNNLSSETWIIPIAAYFHNLYINAVLEAVALLLKQKRFSESASVCRAALTFEPYNEALCKYLMESLLQQGNPQGAAAVYDELSQQLFSDLGIKPGKELHQLYRQATQSISSRSLPVDDVLEYLQESDAADGALQCDYDYFKILCHAQARAMLRSGNATHIAILSVNSDSNTDSARRRLEKTMEKLGEQIRLNLRRGDTFARCSTSQFVLMLPQANYENSSMVCRRVIGAFYRKYPQSTVKIQFVVRPLISDSFED